MSDKYHAKVMETFGKSYFVGGKKKSYDKIDSKNI